MSRWKIILALHIANSINRHAKPEEGRRIDRPKGRQKHHVKPICAKVGDG